MSTIGTFTKTQLGHFEVSLHSLRLSRHEVLIQPVKILRGENNQDYRVYLRGDIEIGAAWSRTSKSGTSYLSVELDDPSLPEPIYAALLHDAGEQYQLVWSRKRSSSEATASADH